ncbi:UNVERIFIED_CONTAM: Aminopeptidase ltah-1.1, partial [Eudyptes robustus]
TFHEDPASCANASEITVRHIHLDWNVSFEKKVVEGKAILDLEVLNNTDHINLDSRDLEIISAGLSGQTLKHNIEDNGALGQKLIINFGQTLEKGSKQKLTIEYNTGKNGASALQFIDKECTADKKKPYLYSQCQAIHARSIAPCMDTPSVKQTYSANVTVPKGLTCLMSGLADGQASEQGDLTLFKYKQPIEIPSYLLAIVVGALEKRDISHRCAVWAEPSWVERARWEFEDTEKMLQAAEQLMGEYEWTRYDLVVLPPSFPFGGMENPCLTFVTPTIIAGDRSLCNVIAHEIAHSYTGNLVTNANWEHFWLNEGFTVFVERKILGRLYGENLRQFDCLCGWEDRLLPCINETFNPVHEYTKLIPRLVGVDPDDAFSTIPYEKGSAFLLYLEQLLGSNQRFEEFLRSYIKKYRRQSIVTNDWISFLKEFFADKKDALEAVDYAGWLNKPGVPPNKPKFDETLAEDCRKLAKKWAEAPIEELRSLDPEVFKKMESIEQVKVLDSVETGYNLSHERVALLEEKYKLSSSGNSEIRFSFILIGIKAKWTPIIPKALEFVSEVGRLKFVKPIYRKLFAWEESKQQALQTFEKNKPFMHPITVIVV